jgi:putative hydrolase of the HAD superfamily
LTEEVVTRRFREVFRRSELEDLTGAGSHLVTSEAIERQRWQRIVAEVLDDVSDASTCFEELFEHFQRPASWQCFPDVAATLVDLRNAGYRLGIASNFDGRLHAVCDGFSELEPLELRIVSAEIGHRKPGVQFFREVERAAACAPSELLMVGDDFENDIAGARQAGWQAVQICRRGEIPPGAISDLSELLPRIAGVQPLPTH